MFIIPIKYIVSLFVIILFNSSNIHCQDAYKNVVNPIAGLPDNIIFKTNPAITAILLQTPDKKSSSSSMHDLYEEELLVTVRINPSFDVDKIDSFLILDEVYDPQRQVKGKILSPYLIEISRGAPIVMYPLEFSKSVKCSKCQNNYESKTGHSLHGQSESNPHKKRSNRRYYEENRYEPVSGHSELPKSKYHKRHAKVKEEMKNSPHKKVGNKNNQQIKTNKNVMHVTPNPIPKINLNFKEHEKKPYYKNENNLKDEKDSALRIGKIMQSMAITEETPFYADLPIPPLSPKRPYNYIDPEDVTEASFTAKKLQLAEEAVNRYLSTKEYLKLAFNNATSGPDFATLNQVSSKPIKANNTKKLVQPSNTVKASENRTFRDDSLFDFINNPKFSTNFNMKISDNLDKSDKEIEIRENEYNGDIQRERSPYNFKIKISHNGKGDEKAKNTARNKYLCGVKDTHQKLNPDLEMLYQIMKMQHYSAPDKISGTGKNDYSYKPFQPSQPITSPKYKDLSYSIKIIPYNSDKNDNNENILRPSYTEIEEKSNSNDFYEKTNNEKKLSFNDRISDDLDPLTNFNKLYEDKSARKTQLLTDYGVSGQQRQIKKTLTNEPQKFLPSRPPYYHIIDDPNLSVDDKLAVLNVLVPNDFHQKNLFELSKDVAHSNAFPYDSQKPEPEPEPEIPSPSTQKKKKSRRKKQSYEQFYDHYEKVPFGIQSKDHLANNMYVSRRATNYCETEVPCATCGGKGKKPPNKPPCLHSECNCRQHPNTCPCKRKIRSIDDSLYTVFNMSTPLPFLATTIHVYRKRQNSWWKITPAMTVNSLSGIFANKNLSIVFSTHVDIFQLEKSLRLQDHQLVVPNEITFANNTLLPTSKLSSILRKKKSKKYLRRDLIGLPQINPKDIFLLDKTKMNSLLAASSHCDKRYEKNLFNDVLCRQIKTFRDNEQLSSSINREGRNKDQVKKDSRDCALHSINDFGYFPKAMSLFERCPNNRKQLCLNMFDDKVPGFSIKMRMPFRENIIIQHNIYKIKIARIITDATTLGALQISVDLINEGIQAFKFSIKVQDCPTALSSKMNTVVQKILYPHVGETITYLLPLITEAKQRKFKCELVVHVETGKTASKKKKKRMRNDMNNNEKTASQVPRSTKEEKLVAKRSLLVEPDNRCFCVWDCKCYCIPRVQSYVDLHICQKLSHDEIHRAGLDLNSQAENLAGYSSLSEEFEQNDASANCTAYKYVEVSLILITFMLILGMMKAVIGLCWEALDSFGFDYITQGKSYAESSRFRIFFINAFFFILFPFLLWCKCFNPSDEDLLVASTEWQLSSSEKRTTSGETMSSGNFEFDEEDSQFSQSQSADQSSMKSDTSKSNRLQGGRDFYKMSNLNESLHFHEALLDDEINENEQMNTKYILQALMESRESLQQLLQTSPVESESLNVVTSELMDKAQKHINDLKTAQIVYRIFEEPKDNIQIPAGTKYCLQGYFLPAMGGKYEFINYYPLAQHRGISPNGESIELIRPPILLSPENFSRIYKNEIDVLEAGDLVAEQPSEMLCINTSTISCVTSISKLTENENN